MKQGERERFSLLPSHFFILDGMLAGRRESRRPITAYDGHRPEDHTGADEAGDLSRSARDGGVERTMPQRRDEDAAAGAVVEPGQHDCASHKTDDEREQPEW